MNMSLLVSFAVTVETLTTVGDMACYGRVLAPLTVEANERSTQNIAGGAALQNSNNR
jgi:hypothetical protein